MLQIRLAVWLCISVLWKAERQEYADMRILLPLGEYILKGIMAQMFHMAGMAGIFKYRKNAMLDGTWFVPDNHI